MLEKAFGKGHRIFEESNRWADAGVALDLVFEVLNLFLSFLELSAYQYRGRAGGRVCRVQYSALRRYQSNAGSRFTYDDLSQCGPRCCGQKRGKDWIYSS